MNKKSSILGMGLILLGMAVFLKNIGIMPRSSLMMFAGIFFFYLYIIKKEQAFLIISLIAALSGSISILRDLKFLRFNMTGEVFLFLLGIIFILLYYSRKNIVFLIPGAILISLGCYVFLMDNFNSARLWPSFFVLLGIAFYFIYFLALYGKENWPLVIGTILIFMGLIFLAYSYEVLDLRIWQYYNYVLPLVLILLGVLLLIKKVKR